MLAAARRGDWDDLVRHEAECARLIEQLERHAETVTLTESDRPRKEELIRNILAEDAEIRDLVNPRLARLQALLSSGANQRKATAAYLRNE